MLAGRRRKWRWLHAAAAVEDQFLWMESLPALSEEAPRQQLKLCWGACHQRSQAMACVEVKRHIFNILVNYTRYRYFI